MNLGVFGWSIAQSSNLISEAILNEARATIVIPEGFGISLSQGYRDLTIEFALRTTAVAQSIINMFHNGDTTSGHYNASGRITVCASTAQTAGFFTVGRIVIADYSNPLTTVKSAQCNLLRPDGSWEANQHYWTSTTPDRTPIYTVTLSPASNTFAIGCTVRAYGSPAGGPRR